MASMAMRKECKFAPWPTVGVRGSSLHGFNGYEKGVWTNTDTSRRACQL